ncbi:MAG TPA: peptidoglycan-binding protein [Ilumatobacter sp.]|nr:peptidoglycan-binding protein [Ilumatobacter sp.]
MLTAPNLRGDDVTELQTTLARIGFDAGKADGIFGPDTKRALEHFQQNSGLYVDGVCGGDTVRALGVLARQTGSGPGVTMVREMEQLTAHARALADLRIVVGQFGGLSALTRQLLQALRQRSATVVASDEPDASAQAAAANRFGASVYLGFEADVADETTIQYFSVPSFESTGGRLLAESVARSASEALPHLTFVVRGMRSPVLRETHMPAVLVTLGSIQQSLDRIPDVVRIAVESIESWASSPQMPSHAAD